MNRRALVIALVIGVLGLSLLVLYQRRFELEASGGEKVRLLTVVKRIDRGKPVTEEHIGTREVPIAYVDDRSIRESDKSKILGLRVGTTVREQELLLWTDLATGSDERKDLSSLVLPGYRAVSVRAGRDDTSVTLVRPGDYVDVIGVLGNGESRSAVVLLQRVLVLSSGTATSPEAANERESKYSFESMLTLSLTLQEAQIVALAAERGRLAVAVRHPDDQQRAARMPDISSDALLKPEVRGGFSGVRTGAPVNLTQGAQ